MIDIDFLFLLLDLVNEHFLFLKRERKKEISARSNSILTWTSGFDILNFNCKSFCTATDCTFFLFLYVHVSCIWCLFLYSIPCLFVCVCVFLGSSMQLKEEKINLDNVHEAMPASYQSDNNKLMVAKEIPEVEVTSKKYKHGKDSAIDVNALSEAKQQAESSNKQLKRKGKSLSSKVSSKTAILKKNFIALYLYLSFTLLFLADFMNLGQFMG